MASHHHQSVVHCDWISRVQSKFNWAIWHILRRTTDLDQMLYCFERHREGSEKETLWSQEGNCHTPYTVCATLVASEKQVQNSIHTPYLNIQEDHTITTNETRVYKGTNEMRVF